MTIDAGHRGDVDDRAACRGEHGARLGLAGQEDAGEVDVDHALPLRVRPSPRQALALAMPAQFTATESGPSAASGPFDTATARSPASVTSPAIGDRLRARARGSRSSVGPGRASAAGRSRRRRRPPPPGRSRCAWPMPLPAPVTNATCRVRSKTHRAHGRSSCIGPVDRQVVASSITATSVASLAFEDARCCPGAGPGRGATAPSTSSRSELTTITAMPCLRQLGDDLVDRRRGRRRRCRASARRG